MIKQNCEFQFPIHFLSKINSIDWQISNTQPSKNCISSLLYTQKVPSCGSRKKFSRDAFRTWEALNKDIGRFIVTVTIKRPFFKPRGRLDDEPQSKFVRFYGRFIVKFLYKMTLVVF